MRLRAMLTAASAATCMTLVACGGGEGPPDETASPESRSQDSQAATRTTTPPAGETAGTGEAERSEEFAGLPAPYNMADYDRGRRTFRLCSSCHLLEEGAGHRVGPNLHGLFSRKVGEAEGFDYSPALMEADFQWTPEQLEQWLANPRDFLPGNRMSFSGVRRPEDRQAVIAYIMVETGYEPDPAGEPGNAGTSE